jgi:hypothetical protein
MLTDCATPAARCRRGALRLPSCGHSPAFPGVIPAPLQIAFHTNRASATGISFCSGAIPITNASISTRMDGTSGSSPYSDIRGEAYLAAGQGTQAAAEFQNILDHSGIVWNCWTGALAHLGVARANALQARASQGADADATRVRALAAYKDFLTLWKNADPDIPILNQAKAVANLR